MWKSFSTFISVFLLLACSNVNSLGKPPRSKLARPQSLFFRGGAAPKENQSKVKTTSPIELTVSKEGTNIPPLVFNLVKGIVGAGVLSLPAGIAAFGDSPSALIPALVLVAIIGILSGYGFALIGKVCAYTGATSYGEGWKESLGESSSWIPSLSAIFMTFSGCLAYSMILADTFSSLLQTKERTKVLLSVTGFLLLPLCWMKNLASLAPFSLLGVIGMGYTAIVMAVRYLDKSYVMPVITESMSEDGASFVRVKAGGKFVEQVAADLKPVFGEAGWSSVFSPKSLIFVCMLSTAYMAHFNAPKFFLELKENTMARYNTVVASSFGASIILMGFIASVGFLTFGKASSGVILNNYASKDALMSLSRIAVAVSLVFGYPLLFQGLRDGTLEIFKIPAEKRKEVRLLNIATILLLSIVTVMAATLKDVTFVLALGGATCGCLLAYVFPAAMYCGMVKKLELKGETMNIVFSIISAVLGVIMGVIGAKMAIDQQLQK
mmetsp:Transcript_39583/g.45094  ORF Transcript_39583/g.45094 Transcript_39583/m.45094 type:complete len:494 (-) Transcript_39583:137-1618(-)